MSDWRSRATITAPRTAPPPINGVVADASQQGSIQDALLALQDGAQPTAQQPAAPVATTSDWRSRAQITPTKTATTSDWRSRATITPKPHVGYTEGVPSMSTVAKAALPMIGIGDRLKEHYAGRDQEIQNSVDATMRGEQTEDEMQLQNALSNASKFTDTAAELVGAVPFVGPAINYVGGKVVEGVAAIPTGGGKTVADRLSDFTTEYPRATRNLKAVGQAVNLGGAALGARAVGNKIEENIKARPSVQRFMGSEGSGAQPKAVGMTAADAGEIATKNYDAAAKFGEKFTPEHVGNRFDSEIKSMKPQPMANGKFTAEDTKFINALEEFEGNTGKSMGLEDVSRIDKAIGDKISQSHIDPHTGAPDASGLRLMKLQTKLRKLVDEVPTTGNDALVNGRNAWATKIRMNDLERIAQWAEVAPGDKAKAINAGARALWKDKERIAGWPQEAKDLLKAAAEPNVATRTLTAVMPKLVAAISGATGDVTGALGAHLAGMAGGSAAEVIAASRLSKVQTALGQDLVNKLRAVGTAPSRALVPVPGTLKTLSTGMTSSQVTIAQKLMEGKKPPTETPGKLYGGNKPPNRFGHVEPFDEKPKQKSKRKKK